MKWAFAGCTTVIALLIVPFAICAAAANSTPLFDGKTFEGWEGDHSVFRIEDGAIVGGSLKEKVAHNAFLCTKKQYGDFELHVTFKLLGESPNAGVQFRTKKIPNNFEVSGFQADMGQEYWGCLYDESRRNKVLAGPDKAELAKVLKPNDWNEYVIRAEGNYIQLWLNGMKTVDYTETDDSIAKSGIIALQIHGGAPSEAWYKDIQLVDLTK